MRARLVLSGWLLSGWLVASWLWATAARAEDPAVQFSPLRVESGQVGDAIGWKVTAAVLSDGLTGRVCQVRFRLQQDARHWEETRKRAISVASWNETAFYKRSFIGETFDARRPVQVTFALLDLVDQRELGSVSAMLPGGDGPALIVDKATVKELGRVVYQGRIDLQPTWERIQRGEKLPHAGDGEPFGDRGHKLPARPKGYWREYVHPTEGVRGAGPQRVIVGRGGEVFYTPDDHRTFVQIR